MMTDSKSLYQEVILDHNKKPRNYGAVAQASHHAEGHNPLCGDHIRVTMQMNGENIAAIAFEGESCAICKASASMMTVAVKGKTRTDAETMLQEFRGIVTGQLDVAAASHIGRLAVFSGVHELPARVKCAILPWHTLHAAFLAEASTSTEEEADPMHASIGSA